MEQFPAHHPRHIASFEIDKTLARGAGKARLERGWIFQPQTRLDPKIKRVGNRKLIRKRLRLAFSRKRIHRRRKRAESLFLMWVHFGDDIGEMEG